MRILHSSDWHLGRRLYGFHLLEDQAYVLQQFIRMAAETEPDLIVLAGDLYDIANPPAESIRLMNEVINELVLDHKRRVLVISGNHDSADRIGFASRLLEESGLLMVGDLSRIEAPLRLRDEYGSVAFYPVPFLETGAIEDYLKRAMPDGQPALYGAAMGSLLDHIRRRFRRKERNVLIAHLAVVGAAPTESEREIGAAGILDAGLFSDFDYVALGHLHRPQSIHDRIRYSGSLMSYSESEAGQQKSASLVTIDGSGNVTVETLPFSPRRRLHVIEGSYFELRDRIPEGVNAEDYIFFRFHETTPEPDADVQLRKRYPNFMNLRWAQSSLTNMDLPLIQKENISDIELFRLFYHYTTGEQLDEEQSGLVALALEKLSKGEEA
jgi:exonuclease SbcD